jgi:DNA-binding protein H-NS
MALKTMSISKLQNLKAQVEAAIAEKISTRRHELESELSKLARHDGGKAKATRGRRGAVAPKYRNPDDRSQTWAGRGLRPRWLVAAMKSGKKLDDFLIGGSRKTAKRRK